MDIKVWREGVSKTVAPDKDPIAENSPPDVTSGIK